MRISPGKAWLSAGGQQRCPICLMGVTGCWRPRGCRFSPVAWIPCNCVIRKWPRWRSVYATEKRPECQGEEWLAQTTCLDAWFIEAVPVLPCKEKCSVKS